MPHCCLLSKYFSLSRKFCKCVKAFPRSNGKGCGRQWLRLPSLSHGALCWGERMPGPPTYRPCSETYHLNQNQSENDSLCCLLLSSVVKGVSKWLFTFPLPPPPPPCSPPPHPQPFSKACHRMLTGQYQGTVLFSLLHVN